MNDQRALLHVCPAQPTRLLLENGLAPERIFVELMPVDTLTIGRQPLDSMRITHHLDLAKSYAEIRRVLKPDGAAVFVEPMAHNPLIALYRWATPKMRTADEHPLLIGDVIQARDHFQQVDSEFFHLTSLAAVPFSRTPVFKPLVRALERTDDLLFGVAPTMRRFAWRVVLVLRKPRIQQD